MQLVLKALLFAIKKHKGQVRKGSNEDYLTHPLKVSYLVTEYKGKSKNREALICAAILHDTIEDTNTTLEELNKKFGIFITSLVYELTNDVEEKKNVGKLEYQKRKMLGMSSYGLFLKLCDMYANITDLPTMYYVRNAKKTLEFLEKKRRFTKSQKLLVVKIKDVINGLITE